MCDQVFRLKFDFEEGAQLKFEFDGKMELCKHTLMDIHTDMINISNHYNWSIILSQ